MIQTLCTILFVIAQTQSPLDNAKQAMQASDFATAIQSYRLVLQEEPESYAARFGLARALAFAGQHQEAIETYTILLEKNPDDTDSLLGRGRTYAWQKNYDDALRDIQAVTQKSPGYGDAWMALGDVCRWMGQLHQAEEAYTQCITLQPDDPSPYLGRARVKLQAGRIGEVEDDLQTAESKGGDTHEIQTLREALEPPQKTVRLAKPHPSLRKHPWQLRYSFDYLAFSPSTTEWLTHRTRIQRDFSQGSIALESIESKRFSEWDDSIAVDGYFDLWNGAYGNLRLQITPDADVLPRWDGYAELFQGFGDGWELSGSYRHMDFYNNNVDLYGIGLGKYLGDWYLREKTTFSSESGDVDISQSFLLRKYIVSEDHFIQFMTGFGDEVITIGAGPIVETRSTHFFSTGGQTYLTRQLGMFVNLNYQDIENLPIRRGFEAGFMIRW